MTEKVSSKIVLIFGVLLILFVYQTRVSLANEDSYHRWLRNFLQSQYGVTGGNWVISDNENTTLSHAYVSNNVNKEKITVSGKPFTRAYRLTTITRIDNWWQHFAHFKAQEAISRNDVLLLIFWVRGISGERGQGFINHTYELIQKPYTSCFSQRQALTSKWQHWVIPIQVERDLPESCYKIHLGFQAQKLEIGGVAVLNFENAYELNDLPHSTHHLDYEGRDPNAEWRLEAKSRIEKHRMKDFKVIVFDANGIPIKGAKVEISMQRHSFGFGTSVYVPERAAHEFQHTRSELDRYYQAFQDLTGNHNGFNWAVIDDELRWSTWENPYWPPWQKEQGQNDTINFFNWLKDQNIKIRGHMLVWPAFKWLPKDIEQEKGNATYIRNRIAGHIKSIAGHPKLKGRVVDWNVINEPIHSRDLENVFGGIEEYAEWFKLAAEADPNAKLYINEYGILSDGGMDLAAQERYKEIIKVIEDNGGRIDGVGMEAHIRYPLTPPRLVYEIINEYAAIRGGKEVSISEYDAKGVEEHMGGEYMRDFLTVTFSHPAVNSFLIWGYWDKNHWKRDAPLYRDAWNLKPSGKAYIDLVFNQWWTNIDGNTDIHGKVTGRGFLGEYEIRVTFHEKTNVELVTLSRDHNIFEILLNNSNKARLNYHTERYNAPIN
jgi:GH35 family endo-1,4-beta-xylanase